MGLFLDDTYELQQTKTNTAIVLFCVMLRYIHGTKSFFFFIADILAIKVVSPKH